MQLNETVNDNAKLVHPGLILADSNARYSLIKEKVEDLKEDIIKEGRIIQNLEVEELPESHESGKRYRLTVGHYRLAAALSIVADGGDIMVPVTVHNNANPVERIRTQLAENLKRQSMTPIDTAVAIQSLQNLGVPRAEIREMFARMGGKKGNKVEAVSHAFVSQHLKMLDLPKSIREKIHDGRIGVGGAFELVRHPKEKQEEIVNRAETQRLAEIEKEERDERKLLDEEKKTAEQMAQEQSKLKEIEELRDLTEQSRAKAERSQEESVNAYTAAQRAEPESKKEAQEFLKEKEAAAKNSTAIYNTLVRKLNKMEGKDEAVKDSSKPKVPKQGDRSPAKKVAKPLSEKDIKKAVKPDDGVVKLNFADIWKAVRELQKPSSYPKVQEIGTILADMFDSKLTPNQAAGKLAVLTGEKKEKK